MRIVINAASIVPGFSTGIENFVYRLLGSLVSLSADDYTVIIPYGTKTAWISRVPRSLNLRYLELPPSASLVQTATRFRHIRLWRHAYDFMRSIQSLRRIAVASNTAAIKKIVESLAPDATYFPYHRDLCASDRSVVTVHDLRAITSEFSLKFLDILAS